VPQWDSTKHEKGFKGPRGQGINGKARKENHAVPRRGTYSIARRRPPWEASSIGRHTAPDWEPFQKLDKVEQPDRKVERLNL
jgi:hypothetical protein